jgi:outer membrane protein assembly factor BamB
MDCTVHAVGADGKERWAVRCGMLGTDVSCIGSDGTIYVLGKRRGDDYADGIHALDANGKTQWFAKVDTFVDGSPAIGSDGTIFVATRRQAVDEKSSGKLFAISRDGKNLWEFRTDCGEGEPLRHDCSPTIGPDGTIYTGTAQKAGGQPGILYAVKPDGTEKWHFATKGQNAGPATIGKDGSVYFCSDNILYALSTDGTKKWEFKTDGKFALSPVMAPDGTIYVVSDKGTLYAVESGSKGLADSAWPMEGHDSQRTGRATGAKTDLK